MFDPESLVERLHNFHAAIAHNKRIVGDRRLKQNRIWIYCAKRCLQIARTKPYLCGDGKLRWIANTSI